MLEGKKQVPFPDINKIPLEPTEDIMSFVMEYGQLEDWEKDIIEIVKEETQYFIPQIETKIMNEGWASYWHYKILSELDLSQDLYLEFLNRHNQVIKPFLGNINPYHLGYKMFEDIEKRYGREKIFEVRQLERDESFIRRYLTEELCKELNLFQYRKILPESDYVIIEVADKDGWKVIRDFISSTTGINAIPSIQVIEVSPKDRSLVLTHEYDGRELNLAYASETLKYLSTLWKGKVYLKTVIGLENKQILCDEDKKISIKSI